MVTNTQEPELRARDLEHERTILDFDEKVFKQDRRADLRPGLLQDDSSRLPIELLHSCQAWCTRGVKSSDGK